MKSIILILSFCSISILTRHVPQEIEAINDNDWKLVVDQGDLKVYKRISSHSSFKEIKATYIIAAPMEEIVEALNDINKYAEWVYKCKEAKYVRKISDSKFIYYNHSDLPYPISDRDMVVVNEEWYDAAAGTIRSFSTIAQDHNLPLKKNVVRIKEFESKWLFKDLGDGRTSIAYEMFLDPGGSLPAWAVNMAVAKGPVKTMRGLEARVK
ncbi:MAG: hypothetical protein ACI94Y_000466 [Maribacter sp.]|jgi:hypothetical protein